MSPTIGGGFWRVLSEPNGGETLQEDLTGDVGVLVNGVVDEVECFKVGEWGLGETLPVRRGEGVEVLASPVCYVVVGGFAILAFWS
jgi:hypothetical protein